MMANTKGRGHSQAIVKWVSFFFSSFLATNNSDTSFPFQGSFMVGLAESQGG